jgi:hypothetical protein
MARYFIAVDGGLDHHKCGKKAVCCYIAPVPPVCTCTFAPRIVKRNFPGTFSSLCVYNDRGFQFCLLLLSWGNSIVPITAVGKILALFVCLTAFNSFRGRLSLLAVDVRAFGYLCPQLGHVLLELERSVSLISDLLRGMSAISNEPSSPVDTLHFIKFA